MKKPNIGDIIRYHEPGFNRTTEGKVVQHLSAQFAFIPHNASIRLLVLYKADFDIIKRARPKLTRRSLGH